MRQKFIVVLLLVGLTGCMAKLSYSFADWVIEWTITDYVSLNKLQKKQLRFYIDRQLLWHKKTQITPYRDWLIAFKNQAEKGLDSEWLLVWAEQGIIFLHDLLVGITPDATAFLISLSDQQVETLIANIDKKQLKLQEQYLSSDNRKTLEERQQRTERSITRLLGKLNSVQKTLIYKWNDSSADSTAIWLQNREQWTRRFERILLTRNSDEFADDLMQLFVYREQFWSDSHRQSAEENIISGIDLALEIELVASEKQRQKLNKFLNKWIATLEKLSK